MSTRPKSPWRAALPLIALLVLFAIWSAYWFTAMTAARAKAEGERGILADKGLTLACTGESWGGYPFRFEYHCGKPNFIYRDKADVSPSDLLVVALAYQPWKLVALFDGPTLATLSDNAPIKIEHDRGSASLNAGDIRQPVLTIDVANVKVPGLAEAGRILASARQRADAIADLAGNATAVHFTPPGDAPIDIDEASFDATLLEPNKLDLHAAAIKMGTVKVSATGTIGLDEQRRPQGQVTIETNDAKGLLGLAQKHAKISDQELQALTAMVAMFGQKATLTAKDGSLFLGPILIGKLKPIVIPEMPSG